MSIDDQFDTASNLTRAPQSPAILQATNDSGPVEAVTTEQARLLAAMARATADAHEQVFELKRKLAMSRELVLAEAQREIEAQQLIISDLREQIFPTDIQFSMLNQQIESLTQQLAEQRERADHFEGYCNALRASTSWRLTAPIRAIVNALRK